MAINTNTFVNGIKILKNALFPSTTIVSNTLIVDASQTTENTLTLPKPASGTTDTILSNTNTATVTNKSIDADTNTITNIDNADVKAAAGIVYSKLSLSNSIVNADINASADIEVSKLESLTTGKALQTNDTTGKIEASAVTNTELGYVAGVTSPIQTQIINTMPAGAVIPYAGSAAPTGYLMCDGSAVSRTTYAALFTALATTYGIGDGSTTFNLPNMAGRVPVGKEATATIIANSGKHGLDSTTLGDTGGTDAHKLTASESGLPAHFHSITDPTHDHLAYGAGSGSTGGSYSATDLTSQTLSYNSAAPATTGITQTNNNSPADASTSHTNLQPSIVLNYIIKY